MTDAALSPESDPDPIWVVARDLFLSGDTAVSICARLGVPASTFWKKAAEHGWLRRDQASNVPAPQAIDPDAAAITHLDAMREAWGRAMTALRAGRAAETRYWLRIRADLQADLARHDQERHRERAGHIDEITRTARGLEATARAELREIQAALKADRRAAADTRMEKVENDPPNSTPAAPLDPDAPGLTRAERRRRQKYLARTRPPSD